MQVFDLPMLTMIDDRDGYGEDRWIGLGLMRGVVIVVVFTEPNQNTIRIISARKATKYEEKKFYEILKN